MFDAATPFGERFSAETHNELRRLNIEVRRSIDKGFVGAYRSAFRGHGVEFEELREYSPGDDIRSIDWQVTAKAGKPYLKTYREERELSVVLAIDISGSTTTGSGRDSREVAIAKIAAALAVIALGNNDRVSILTFSDRPEYFHPPSKNPADVWRILHTAVDTKRAQSRRTSLNSATEFLSKTIKKTSVVFLISDFLNELSDGQLNVLARKHDVTAIHITDPSDTKAPAVSLAAICDPETSEHKIIDFRHKGAREAFIKAGVEHQQKVNDYFTRRGVDVLKISTNDNLIHKMREYFISRAKRTLL